MATQDTTQKPEESPWNEEARHRFQTKRPGEYYDPCQEAATRSYKCLHRNRGDKEMCQDYFQAYRDCKKEWMTARQDEKRKSSKSWFS